MKGKSVWKFPIEITNHQMIQMPKGSQPLFVGLDPQGTPCIWALVTPENEPQEITIFVYGTGHSISGVVEKGDNYIGTFVDGKFVWHVFS